MAPRRSSSSILTITLLFVFGMSAIDPAESLRTIDKQFGPFDSSYYNIFKVESPATISNGALQMTPDSAGNLNLKNRSGRVLFNQRFKLWDGSGRVASFNTSFIINIFRIPNQIPGEGLAFVIAPDLDVPPGSSGQYLGLTNSTTDGNSGNHLLAVEFDTFKQDFDPDSNHVGLDINSVRSSHTASLTGFGLQLAPDGTKFFHVWVLYDGAAKRLAVYMADEETSTPTKPMPDSPVMNVSLDIAKVVNEESYFGFAASTGTYVELNCVLGWNLTVENLSKSGNKATLALALALGIGLPVLAALAVGLWWTARILRRRRMTAADDQSDIVVCGQKPLTKIGDFQLLVDWVWYLHRDGRLLEAVDRRLGGDYNAEEAGRLLLLGLACSHPTASERPKTPAVVQILAGSAQPPVVPFFRPSFVWPPMDPPSIDGSNTDDTTPVTSSQFGSGWTRRDGVAGYSDSSLPRLSWPGLAWPL
ncbi:hypothetical protein SAY87_017061 [Trapa incisa]|uniref:Legume lectin domain-containing protein n=1 Tax=Trapa incisa TaxID=236973 RepID=A0AAN7LGY9_9MYRT|nr:hypothetical protein SAY87_017061 [Trapa incisa]